MRLRNAARVVHIDRNIRLRPAQINRHAHGAFRVGDSLHAMGHILPAPLKFALELRHERIGVLAIQIRQTRGASRSSRPRRSRPPTAAAPA